MYNVGDVVKYQTTRVVDKIIIYYGSIICNYDGGEIKTGIITERVFSPYVSTNFYWIKGESEFISEPQILGKEIEGRFISK